MIDLRARVLDHVRSHPGLTVEEIARGVQARTAAVRDVLLAGGFSSSLRLAYPSDRARVYDIAPQAADGRGRLRKPSQCDLILRVLRDGGWHSAAEIHHRCGYSRLNSRIAELRRRGMTIVCEHIAGAGTGAEAYRYQLIATSEEAAAAERASSLPHGEPAAASSDVSIPGANDGPEASGAGLETSDCEQLSLEAAA